MDAHARAPARTRADRRGNVTCKTIHFPLASADGEKYALYIKQGWETMAMVKPLHLFQEECELGRYMSTSAAVGTLDANNAKLEKKIAERKEKLAKEKAEKAKKEKGDGGQE